MSLRCSADDGAELRAIEEVLFSGPITIPAALDTFNVVWRCCGLLLLAGVTHKNVNHFHGLRMERIEAMIFVANCLTTSLT